MFLAFGLTIYLWRMDMNTFFGGINIFRQATPHSAEIHDLETTVVN